MTETILVGVDPSPAAQRALAWAAQYALGNHLTVVAVHVLTYSTEFHRDLPPTGLSTWRKTLRDRLEHTWVRPLREAGVPYRTALVEDDSVEAGLIRAATDNDVALVVLGAHGHGNLKDRLLGSVTYKLTHRGSHPVVVVPLDWPGPLAQIGAQDALGCPSSDCHRAASRRPPRREPRPTS